MPNEGVFVNRKVSKEQAWEIIANAPAFTSALGHQGSADVFNAVFPTFEVSVNRIQAQMQPKDEAVCLKVLGRLPEGQILSLEQLQDIGFEFFHVQMVMGITENPIAFTCEMGGSKNEKTFTAFGECKF